MSNPNRRSDHSEQDQIKGAAQRLLREGVPLDEAGFRAEDTKEFREKVRKAGQSIFGAPEVTAGAKSQAAETAENKRELSPETTKALIQTLKSRFDSADKNLHKALASIDFAAVEKRLRDNKEALFSLNKLEETGGEPQLVCKDGEKFVFEDRSAESPWGRRDKNFDQSADQAKEFGVELQNEASYREMQKTGKYDLNSWSWLKTPKNLRETGYAMRGVRYHDALDVGPSNAVTIYEGQIYSWRGVLRV